ETVPAIWLMPGIGHWLGVPVTLQVAGVDAVSEATVAPVMPSPSPMSWKRRSASAVSKSAPVEDSVKVLSGFTSFSSRPVTCLNLSLAMRSASARSQKPARFELDVEAVHGKSHLPGN